MISWDNGGQWPKWDVLVSNDWVWLNEVNLNETKVIKLNLGSNKNE